MTILLLREVDQEVRLVFLVGFLEIAIGVQALEAGLGQELAHVLLAQRKHVELVLGPVREGVAEARQPGIDMLGLDQHPVAAIVVLVLGIIALVEDRIVVRSEEHTSELQSLMRISYAVFSSKKKKIKPIKQRTYE